MSTATIMIQVLVLVWVAFKGALKKATQTRTRTRTKVLVWVAFKTALKKATHTRSKVLVWVACKAALKANPNQDFGLPSFIRLKGGKPNQTRTHTPLQHVETINYLIMKFVSNFTRVTFLCWKI